MNKKQLEYVMNELDFVGGRRLAMQYIIIDGMSGYKLEKYGKITKGTATRDAKKCRDKWEEVQAINKAVNKLIKDNT